MDTLLKVPDMESRVAGHDGASSEVSEAVSEAEAVSYHWGSTSGSQNRTAECAGRQDDVVDAGVRWVSIQALERLALGLSQLVQSLEVAAKALTCGGEGTSG